MTPPLAREGLAARERLGGCGCKPKIPRDLKVAVIKGDSELREQLKTLARFYSHLQGAYNIATFYFYYTKGIASTIGLQVKGLTYRRMIKLLRYIYEKRTEIGKLKTAPGTYL